MLTSRRGFSLVELLVAMILVVIVGGAMYSMLLTVQRVSGRQTEVAGMNANLRAGVQLIQNELSELGTNNIGATGVGSLTQDLVSIGGTGITYNALRGLGETCAAVTLTHVFIRKPNYNGLRRPDARERVWVYIDSDTAKTSDDKWVSATISGVADGTCADGLTAAYDLTVGGLVQTDVDLTQTFYPLPVRTYERMAIGQVTDNGQNWLGIRSLDNSENTLIPVIGPLASTGVAFTYLDKDNAPTAAVASVKTIGITLYGITDRPVNASGFAGAVGSVNDSLKIRVQIRNSQ